MDIFKSDLKLVVAAYNAGENAVLRYNSVPPFKETQEYVKKVFQHLKSYEQISPVRKEFSNGVKGSNERTKE